MSTVWDHGMWPPKHEQNSRAMRYVNRTCSRSPKRVINDIQEDKLHAVKELLQDLGGTLNSLKRRWSPFPEELFKDTRMQQKVVLSAHPHQTGCHDC